MHNLYFEHVFVIVSEMRMQTSVTQVQTLGVFAPTVDPVDKKRGQENTCASNYSKSTILTNKA